jgi:hypothetical protein
MKRKLVITIIALFALLLTSISQANATVYARLERGTLLTDHYNGYYLKYYTTVQIHFYSDVSCAPQYAIPAPADIDVTINLQETDFPTGGWPSYGSNTPTTFTIGAGNYYYDWWFTTQMVDCYDDSTDTVIYTLSLLPGSGYVVVN